MDLLYDYLTSSTFRMQIEAIVEGFTQMKSDLDSEKRSMQRIWKQREKQIEKVVTNTIDMYGSVKGIAGNAIQSVKALELPEVDNYLPTFDMEKEIAKEPKKQIEIKLASINSDIDDSKKWIIKLNTLFIS